MDIGSVLRPDAYRLLITNLVPGSVAVSPWAFCVIAPNLLDAASWSGGAGVVLGGALLLATLTVGTILEDVGARIEVSIIDKRLRGQSGGCPSLNARWNRYLKLRVNDELVAQRYLRNFLVRYKFELSMITALPIGAVGLLAAHSLGTGLDLVRTLGLVAVAAVTTWFLWREANAGREALHDLRGLILKAVQSERKPDQR